MTPKIEKIIVKYLTNSASLNDLDILSEWIEKGSNKVLFKEYVKTHFAINYSISDPETNIAIEQLLAAIRKEKSIVYKIKKQPIYRYIAAASVLLIVALTIYMNRANQTHEVIEPTIVKEVIVPGTDKATLTLANGEQVILEKGMSFQTPNAKSNGEQILYNTNKKKIKELEYNYLTIPRGGEYYMVLSDGTKVWLNSESQLKYPVSFIEGKTRQVELVYGEAYFDVTPSSENKGAKFMVLNKSQEVEVLGTEFNIKAYKDETNIYTTLVEGKVAVEHNNKTQNLTPSYQSVLNLLNNRVIVAKVDVRSEVSWKDGFFRFREKPLKDIMKVISRWYDVDVVFENKELEEITFKGVLEKDQNLEELLTTIQTLSIIKNYEIYEKTITLK